MLSLLQKFNQNLDLLGVSNATSCIAVAVSGGADSIALLILAHQWAGDRNCKIITLTVNHNLRPEASEEVEFVRAFCLQRNIEHHAFKWEYSDNIGGNLHDNARNARYNFMINFCVQNDISYLFTAHHLDDKIENFFIRLSKASGIFGLCGHESRIVSNISIIRPLHNIHKNDLITFLNHHNISWCEDPSNVNDKYLRSKIRKWLTSAPQEFKTSRIVKAMEYIAQAASYIENDLEKYFNSSVTIYSNGSASWKVDSSKKFLDHMILSYLVTIISGNSKLPRSDSVSYILNNLHNKKVFSLHGCKVKYVNAKYFIYREFGRKRPDSIKLCKNLLWDNRWRSSYDMSDYAIDSITQDEFLLLQTNEGFKKKIALVSHEILFTLPVIRKLEKLIAIPHIEYYDDLSLKHVTFSFEIRYVSRLVNLSQDFINE